MWFYNKSKSQRRVLSTFLQVFYNNLELLAAVVMRLDESIVHLMIEGRTRDSNTRYSGSLNITHNLDIPSISCKQRNGGRGRRFPNMATSPSILTYNRLEQNYLGTGLNCVFKGSCLLNCSLNL